uniref:Uncharacterized protein n=1 Tax=mine drainage metagenome TaxID=410659 RepID=E6Q8T6_9ZZZZ
MGHTLRWVGGWSGAGVVALLFISTCAIAGTTPYHLVKPVNASAIQDRMARNLARMAIGGGPSTGKAYKKIIFGEKNKSPSMTYALSYFYKDKWQHMENRAGPQSPLLNNLVGNLDPDWKRKAIAGRAQESNVVYKKSIFYLAKAAHLGDPAAESGLGYEYFWEPLREFSLVEYMSHKNGGIPSDAIEQLITSNHFLFGRAWVLALDKSLKWEEKAGQRNSPAAVFNLALDRVVLGRLTNKDDIEGYAPHLARAIRTYIYNSRNATMKRAAELGNPMAIEVMMCTTYSDGGDPKIWWKKLNNERNRPAANALVNVVNMSGGIGDYCKHS